MDSKDLDWGQYGIGWFKMARMMISMVQNDLGLFMMVQNGQDDDQYGLGWFRIVYDGLEWLG